MSVSTLLERDIVNGKEKVVRFMQGDKGEARAERIVGWAERFAILFPLGVILMSVTDYVGAFRNPTIIRTADGEGDVRGTVLELADPTVLDRFVAALPALSILFAVLFAFGYLVRSNFHHLKDIKGEKASRARVLVIGLTGVLVLILSMASDILVAAYFDTQLLHRDIDYTPLFLALGLIVLEGLYAKDNVAEEQERADELDKKIKDVV